MCSEVGLILAISLALRVIPLGLLFGGIPCDSFGFMASFTHGRSGAEPWGHMGRPFVYRGTLCATRFAALALIGMARGCCYFIEQPSRTTLPFLPPIRELLHYDMNPAMTRWS